MDRQIAEVYVQPDAFHVARGPALLSAELHSALAVCLYDDTQGVGGLLHLRYVATDGDQPLDLTDNTLSSDLLLMDRFCKELRALGARKQSWRVSILGQTPQVSAMQGAAATVLELVKAYFADGRRPVECREFGGGGLLVRLEAREGQIWVSPSHAGAAALSASVGG